jgi:HlyD family secretion protein
VEEACATLAAAESNLDFATIRSPSKGIIIDRRVSVGQPVTAAPNPTTLLLIAKDLKRLQVWASVKRADIPRLHPGQRARFAVDAYPGRTFNATVRQVWLSATLTQNLVTTPSCSTRTSRTASCAVSDGQRAVPAGRALGAASYPSRCSIDRSVCSTRSFAARYDGATNRWAGVSGRVAVSAENRRLASNRWATPSSNQLVFDSTR